MNEEPSHRMRLYVEAKAMPLKAPDTISGSPSPWKEFASIPIQTNESVVRLDASLRFRDVIIILS